MCKTAVGILSLEPAFYKQPLTQEHARRLWQVSFLRYLQVIYINMYLISQLSYRGGFHKPTAQMQNACHCTRTHWAPGSDGIASRYL
jgi:hypothetical protein